MNLYDELSTVLEQDALTASRKPAETPKLTEESELCRWFRKFWA